MTKISNGCIIPSLIQFDSDSSVAQSVEHLTVNQGVAGSSPARGAISEKIQGMRGHSFFIAGDKMIDSRIKTLANFVNPGSRAADIGADHGYLSIELLKSGKAKFVIATDKNSGPAEVAEKNIVAAGLENFVEVRRGDGLKVINPGEVDTICIAGMGGALICEILRNSPEVVNSADNLILQPMNAPERVSDFISEIDWKIEDIDLAEVGGIVYEIFLAVKPENFSVKTFKKDSSPLLANFLNQRLKKLIRVRNEMSKSARARSGEKFLSLVSEIEKLKNFLNGG